MPLDFPNSPTHGQVFTAIGISWTWDGVKWISVIPADSSYLLTSGGTMTGAITLAGNATQPLHAVPLQQLNASLSGINATNYGVIADGTTDNTAALQAAINAVQTMTASTGTSNTLLLPQGVCVSGPLTISGQIGIRGVAGNGSVLRLKADNTAPLITIANGAGWTASSPFNEVRLSSVRLESQDGKTGGGGTAHGIHINNGGTSGLRVMLENVYIYNMGGNGIDCGGMNGWVDCRECDIRNNGGIGVQANSVNDWHFYGGVICTNTLQGVLLAGASQCAFYGTNIFANGQANLQLFCSPALGNGEHNFFGCMFDYSAQHGVIYDIRGTGGVQFWGCTFSACGVGSTNLYSDCLISSAANNKATFNGCIWQANNAQNPARTEHYALEFQGTTQTVTLMGEQILLGPTLSTNQPAQIIGWSTVRPYLKTTGGVGIEATQQFGGLALSNGTNVVAKLSGFDATNDKGILSLASAGTTIVQLSAASGAPNYINSALYLGNGSTSATPTPRTLAATGGSGTDIAGAGLFLTGGIGTGAGAGGSIFLCTSPTSTTGSTPNTVTDRLTIDTTGLATFANNVRVNGNVGFYNTAPVAKPTVSGAKGSNAALASLMTALAALGLVTDTTTA